MSILHFMPTQTGKHCSPIAVRLHREKSCYNSGGHASSSSKILRWPEGFHAPAKLLPIDAGVDDGPQVRESLTVVARA